MSNHICLILPFPPSVNALWRAVRGRNIKSAKGRDYDTRADVCLQQQQPLPRFTQPVSVEAAFGRPDKRKRDIDNFWKTVGDALERNGILENDHLIHRLLLYWCPDVVGVRVEIMPFDAPLFARAG